MAPAQPNNITGLYDLFSYVNGEVGIFGMLVVLMTFIVLFLAMKERFTTSRAFAGSIFVTFFVAAFFRILGLVSNFVLIVVVIGLIMSIFYLRLDDEG